MREIIDFCDGWLFHEGDIKYDFPSDKGIAYLSGKTESAHYGPACKTYRAEVSSHAGDHPHNTERWENVSLPHDYVIRGIPEKKYSCALGFLPYRNAWYIKYFTAPAEWEGKRVTLYFEGVATHAEVWLNGCRIARSFSGYTPFTADLTELLCYGGANTLSVYVNTEEHESWWYEGGGIYRPVTLTVTDAVAIDRDGIYVHPEKEREGWRIPAEITLFNAGYTEKNIILSGNITDAAGKTAATFPNVNVTVPPRTGKTVIVTASIAEPSLWSPDAPNLYRADFTVSEGNTKTDADGVRFGFRTFVTDPEHGLFINGKPYRVFGVCGHADCGLFGKAVPENIHRYKVQLLKEMGANGYRTSHYPQSAALMDALDEAGFIVMDETRLFSATEEGQKQLSALVRRDRNHPSVFFWSVGNEEPKEEENDGVRIFRAQKALIRSLDKERPVTMAVNYAGKAKVFDDCDILGINYCLDEYDEIRKRYPDKMIIATETCATGTTRGWYFGENPNRAYLPAYDRTAPAGKFYDGREDTINALMPRSYVAGFFQWIAFEHRGEAIWPRLCSQSGAIDLFLQKKDAFYQNKSHWTEEPMIHIATHWNFIGMETTLRPVHIYTNCEEVELFLNGKSFGRQTVSRYGSGFWQIPFAPGTLLAVAYRGGTKVASDERMTTGTPVALRLTQDTADIAANGRDYAICTCTAIDENGLEVPDAEPEVSFFTDGDCCVFSTGSDISEHDTICKSEQKMRAGRISVAVRLGTDPHGMVLYAKTPGLATAALPIKVR